MSDKQNCAHYLQINHVPGKRNLWVLPGVHSGNVRFLDLLLHKPCSPGTIHQQNVPLIFFFQLKWKIFNYLLNFLSISSHLLTSFTNLRWNTFISGLSCGWEWKKREAHIYCLRREIQNLPNLNPPQTKFIKCHWNHPSLSVICRTSHLGRLLCRRFSFFYCWILPIDQDNRG